MEYLKDGEWVPFTLEEILAIVLDDDPPSEEETPDE